MAIRCLTLNVKQTHNNKKMKICIAVVWHKGKFAVIKADLLYDEVMMFDNEISNLSCSDTESPGGT